MIGAVMSVLALAAAVAQAPIQADEAFGGAPDVDVTYYDVSGRNAAEIRSAINMLRPADPNDGKPVDGLTKFDFRWRWPGTGNGGCTLDRADVTFRATVLLPRLTNLATLSGSLQKRWDRYIAALAAHEAGHVANAYGQRDRVVAAVRSATCATVNAAGSAAIRQIADSDIAYDRRTQHGRTQGAVFP